MAIRINLLSEALAEEDLRRRDPVKRTIYAGAFFIVLSLVWFSSTWLEYMVDKGTLNRIEGSIQLHTNDYAQVQENNRRIGELQKRMQALDQLTSDRFLQGNFLNALQQTYVSNIQIIRLKIDQTYSVNPAAKTNSGGRFPALTQHVLLTMDAKDFSASPGDQVPHFKAALSRQDYFSQHLDTTNGIRLSSLSALQPAGEGKPYVLFTLECRFLDKTP